MQAIRLLIVYLGLAGVGLAWTGVGLAADAEWRLPLEYSLIRSVLVSQLYTGADETARLWKDGNGCSFLDVAKPRIAASGKQVEIIQQAHARLGVKILGKCTPALEWRGFVQTLQQPRVDVSGEVLSFPVSQIKAYDEQQRALQIGELQELINKAARPKLDAIKLDLREYRSEAVKNLARYVSQDRAEPLREVVDSLRFKRVEVGVQGLQATLGFKAPPASKAAAAPQPPFSEAEMAQWRRLWEAWQAGLSPDSAGEHEADLQDLLLEADAAFTEGLSADNRVDPVTRFFKASWDKFAPLLRQAAGRHTGVDAAAALTLIGGADALYHLNSLGKPLGLSISSQGLRAAVRAYLAQRS